MYQYILTYCKLLKNVPVHTHALYTLIYCTLSCTVHSYTFTHVLYKRKTLTKVPCKNLCTVNTYRLISTHSSTVQTLVLYNYILVYVLFTFLYCTVYTLPLLYFQTFSLYSTFIQKIYIISFN